MSPTRSLQNPSPHRLPRRHRNRALRRRTAGALGEHLRTVHFALLTMCLLLLGSVLQYKPAPLSTAIANLKAIAALGPYSDKINVELTRTADAAVESARAKGRSLQLGQPVYVLGTWPDGTVASYELQYSRSWVGPSGGGYSEQGFTYSYSAKTVGEFANYWDSLMTVAVLPIPPLTSATYFWFDNVTHKSSGKTLVLETSLARFKAAVKATIRGLQDTSPLLSPIPLKLHWAGRYSLRTDILLGRNGISMLVPQEELTVNMQPAFLAATGNLGKWKTGEFNQSFGELSYTQASIINPLTFSDALAYETRTAAAEASKEDYTEIFGAKLPRKSIGNWGTFIPLGIQTYMLLSLFQMRKEFWERGCKISNWIGTYHGIGATVFAISTCTVLPAALTFLFSVREWKTSGMQLRAFYLTATTISSLVSLLLVRQLLYFSTETRARTKPKKSA